MKNSQSDALRATIRRFRSRSGLASALIIMVLVLLIFFGVFSMVLTAADLRLSRKRAVWNQHYYLADSAAVAVFADLDRFCRAQDTQGLEKDALKTSLEWYLAENTIVRELQITEDENLIRARILVFDQTGILAGNSANTDAAQQQGIEMILAIRTGVLPDATERITIESWTQWQAPFDYNSEDIGVWEG